MPDFQTQFKTKKKIDFHGRSIAFVDVIPATLKSATPIFIAPGWGETPRTFRDLMHLLFDAGYRVISVTHPRQDLKLITSKNISRFELQKAEIILAVLHAQGIQKVNAIAHSEGAINAVLAAHTKTSAFSAIIMVGPGGLVENEGFVELTSRFIGNMLQGSMRAIVDSVARRRLIRSGIETFRYFLMNPIMSLLEGSAISRTHLRDLLVELHQAGIVVDVIQGSEDIVFPIKKMQSLSDLTWIGFYTTVGDHSDIYAHPQNYIYLLLSRFMKIDERHTQL